MRPGPVRLLALTLLLGLCLVESFMVTPPAAVRLARPHQSRAPPRAVRLIRRFEVAGSDAVTNGTASGPPGDDASPRSSNGDSGGWAAPRGEGWVRPDVVEASKQWARLSCAVALTPRSSLDQTDMDAKEVGRWSVSVRSVFVRRPFAGSLTSSSDSSRARARRGGRHRSLTTTSRYAATNTPRHARRARAARGSSRARPKRRRRRSSPSCCRHARSRRRRSSRARLVLERTGEERGRLWFWGLD